MDEILALLPSRLACALSHIDSRFKDMISDIWIKTGAPLSVCMEGKCMNVRSDGTLCSYPYGFTVRASETQAVFMRLCDYSVYAYEDELVNGFVTIRGGHRAGVYGTAVYDSDELSSVKDISGINIRIARQRLECSSGVFDAVYDGTNVKNVLIAAPPAAGKTTILRDLARKLSICGVKTAVIDERGELSACEKGSPAFDLGPNCAVYYLYKKVDGITRAVRTLSPTAIILDEVSDAEECARIEQAMNSGVSFLMSAHARNREDLLKRPLTRRLIHNGSIQLIVLIGSDHSICQMFTPEEIM